MDYNYTCPKCGRTYPVNIIVVPGEELKLPEECSLCRQSSNQDGNVSEK